MHVSPGCMQASGPGNTFLIKGKYFNIKGEKERIKQWENLQGQSKNRYL